MNFIVEPLALKTIIFLLIGSPLFIWGLITNYIPYKVPRMLVDLGKTHSSEMASWKLAYGFILFIIYYGFSALLIWKITGQITFTILFLLSLIPSGNFALYYSKSLMKYRQHVKFLSIFYKKRNSPSQHWWLENVYGLRNYEDSH